MLLNLLNWLILTSILFAFGISVALFFKLTFKNLLFTEIVLLGLLPILLISITTGFMFRINIEFFLFCLVSAIIILWTQHRIVKEKLKEIKNLWHKSPNTDKVIFIVFILITGIQASMPTNIPDDGLYYLQTVKWANNYGIPSGVMQYGLQYGQFSSWHIFQATFNFSSFFGNRLNNANGWILVLFVAFLLQKFYSNSSMEARLFAFASALLTAAFQYFVTAPSPDLPIILISIIVFYYFLFEDRTRDYFTFVCLLTLTAILIKPTAFYLLLFLLFYGRQISLSNKRLFYLASTVVILLLFKNFTTSGSWIFPFNFQLPIWTADKEVLIVLEDKDLNIWDSTFGKHREEVSNISLYKKFIIWLFQLGHKSVVNIVWVLSIVIIGFISFIKHKVILVQIFIISIIEFTILWQFSPNYRFALPMIILNSTLILIIVMRNFNVKSSYLFFSLLLSGIWLTPFIGPILNISNNNVVSINYPLKAEYLLIRSKPFVSPDYDKVIFNGQEVYIPPKYHYAWDGPLPCVMRFHYEKYSELNLKVEKVQSPIE